MFNNPRKYRGCKSAPQSLSTSSLSSPCSSTKLNQPLSQHQKFLTNNGKGKNTLFFLNFLIQRLREDHLIAQLMSESSHLPQLLHTMQSPLLLPCLPQNPLSVNLIKETVFGEAQHFWEFLASKIKGNTKTVNLQSKENQEVSPPRGKK